MTDHLNRMAEAPQTDQPAAPGAIIRQFGYQPLFNAISAATKWEEGRTIGVSVAAFEASLLDATPEAPAQIAPIGTPQNPICIDSEEMAGLAEFAGISVDNREDAVGILLWVGEHRNDDGTVGYGLCASLEDCPEEGCYPLVELPRMQTADGAATLRSAIRDMASMLQAREWAEHVSTDPVVTDLEVQITELVSTATKLREQNAALVAALEGVLRWIDHWAQTGLGINLPSYERRFERGRIEYRMARPDQRYTWGKWGGVTGDWAPTKKEAKASYKAALAAHRARIKEAGKGSAA